MWDTKQAVTQAATILRLACFGQPSGFVAYYWCRSLIWKLNSEIYFSQVAAVPENVPEPYYCYHHQSYYHHY
jgi:hypothetical protein